MDKFVYEYPTKVFLGSGMVESHFAQAASCLGKKVMVSYGGGSAKRSGSLDKVLGILEKAGCETVEFGGIMPNPTYAKVQQGAALAKEREVTGILALGGGSVVDASKIIALQAANSADVWKAEIGREGPLDRAPLPLAAVVTSSGTGSEMNGGAVITNEELNVKTGLFAAPPRYAFLDYEFMKSVPSSQVLSGAFDTFSHAMETYLGTSSELNPSDYISLAVMKNTADNIDRILVDINDEEARSNLMWDSAMAENGILKLGRFTDFEVHQIEHQLGAYTDCNHGQGLAVLTPVYCRHVYKAALGKFATFARVVFGVESSNDEEAALLGIEKIELMVRKMGLATRLHELKMKDSPEKLLSDGNLRLIADSVNILTHGPRTLSHDEVYQILKECM